MAVSRLSRMRRNIGRPVVPRRRNKILLIGDTTGTVMAEMCRVPVIAEGLGHTVHPAYPRSLGDNVWRCGQHTDYEIVAVMANTIVVAGVPDPRVIAIIRSVAGDIPVVYK